MFIKRMIVTRIVYCSLFFPKIYKENVEMCPNMWPRGHRRLRSRAPGWTSERLPKNSPRNAEFSLESQDTVMPSVLKEVPTNFERENCRKAHTFYRLWPVSTIPGQAVMGPYVKRTTIIKQIFDARTINSKNSILTFRW